MEDEDVKALTEHLSSVGCSKDEISQILIRVRKFDEQMIHQSVFDSIAAGSFSIDAVINEVRANEDSEDDQNSSKP